MEKCERVDSKNLPLRRTPGQGFKMSPPFPPSEIEEILEAAPPGLVARAAAQIGTTRLEKLTPFTLQHAPKHRHLKHKNLAIPVLFKVRCRASV